MTGMTIILGLTVFLCLILKIDIDKKVTTIEELEIENIKLRARLDKLRSVEFGDKG